MRSQYYFSIALGAILVVGSVAMLMHGPRAAAARDAEPRQQRDEVTAKPAVPASTAGAPSQR